jgi:hypothetical protein
MKNGGSALFGEMATPTTWRSWIIIRREVV